jgi:iron complex transport system substrate-binding protein
MRIASLLPALTELVGMLGHAGDLVGVSHECDAPPEVARLPRLTRSRINIEQSSDAIDAAVSASGGALYTLEEALLAELRPDVILTQAQCEVCAVDEQTVRQVASGLPITPHVEAVNPTDLAGVRAMFVRIGGLLGEQARTAAERWIARFDETRFEIARRRAGRPIPRVLHLEWLDPPFCSGHWNPELIELAGGREVIGRPGVPSRRCRWDEVFAAAPEVVLVAPCGFPLDRAARDVARLNDQPGWRALPAVRDGRVAVADGNAYFSRPGPRLEANLRIAATAIDPETCGDLATSEVWQSMG